METEERGRHLMSERDRERLKKLRLMDDDFFRVCFMDDKEGAEFILRIILDRQDLTVTEMRTQHSIKNLHGHSVILDVFATDSEDVQYSIEIQRADRGAKPKRARYICSVMDANALHCAEDYRALPRTYVIFITENDVLGEGRLIYHIHRVIEESGSRFNDESHILYVNASFRDDSALGQLMHDFNCADPAEMKYNELRQRTQPYKDETEGENKMCQIWEEIRQEGIEMGRKLAEQELAEAKAEAAEARAEAKAEAEAKAKAEAEAKAKAKAEAEAEAKERERATKTAIRMIRRGNLTREEIAEYTGLTEDEVQEYIMLIAG